MFLEIDNFDFGNARLTFNERCNREFEKLSPEQQKVVLDFTKAAVTDAVKLSMRVLDIEISHIDET